MMMVPFIPPDHPPDCGCFMCTSPDPEDAFWGALIAVSLLAALGIGMWVLS